MKPFERRGWPLLEQLYTGTKPPYLGFERSDARLLLGYDLAVEVDEHDERVVRDLGRHAAPMARSCPMRTAARMARALCISMPDCFMV